MIRAAGLLVVVAIAALFALQFADDPGEITLRWGGTTVITSALFALIALALVAAAVLPALRFAMVLFDAPGQVKRVSQAARTQKGQEALALGLIAAEAGEFDEAHRCAVRASEAIEEPRLAKLLSARACEAAGDLAGAERAYTAMLTAEDTELLGRKGLLTAALKRGDRTAALAHADAALRVSKTAAWPFETLFDLRVQSADWEGALAALEEAEKRRIIDEDAGQRRKAVLLSAMAQKEEREGHIERASDFAERAVRLAATFSPAAALSARVLVAEGKAWKAQSVLEEAWEASPHPALAHAYRDIKDGETAAERQKRLMGLVELKPDHRESRILAAEIAMQQLNWQAAWDSLDLVYRDGPTSRVCALFASICKQRGDEDGAKRWLAQAAVAPREPDWSDLDPEGPAFAYDSADWARLVYSFGDDGRLIHPRLERGARDVGPKEGAAGSLLALPPTIKGAGADPGGRNVEGGATPIRRAPAA